MRVGVGSGWARVHELRSRVRLPTNDVKGQSRQFRHGAVQVGPAAVQLGKTPEVGRERTEAREEGCDKGLLIRDSEERIVRVLLPDRRRARRATWCRAERSRPVCRIDRQRIRQRENPLAQRMEQPPCERRRLVRAEQIGPPHRSNHERTTTEQHDRRVVLGAR